MPHPLLVLAAPAALLAAGIGAVASIKKPVTAPAAPAPPIETLLMVGRDPYGNVIRAFRPDVAAELLGNLDNLGIEYEATPGDADGNATAFKVLPTLEPGRESAGQIAREEHANGNVIVGSLALVHDEGPVDAWLLVVCKPDFRKIASPASQFAIILDVAHVAKKAAPTYDAKLPPNVLAVVEAAIADPAPFTEHLRLIATTLAAFPVATQALLNRADAIDLERSILATLAGHGIIAAVSPVEVPAAIEEAPAASVAAEPAPAFDASSEPAVAVPDETVTVEATALVSVAPKKKRKARPSKPSKVVADVAAEVLETAERYLNGSGSHAHNDADAAPAETLSS